MRYSEFPYVREEIRQALLFDARLDRRSTIGGRLGELGRQCIQPLLSLEEWMRRSLRSAMTVSARPAARQGPATYDSMGSTCTDIPWRCSSNLVSLNWRRCQFRCLKVMERWLLPEDKLAEGERPCSARGPGSSQTCFQEQVPCPSHWERYFERTRAAA